MYYYLNYAYTNKPFLTVRHQFVHKNIIWNIGRLEYRKSKGIVIEATDNSYYISKAKCKEGYIWLNLI